MSKKFYHAQNAARPLIGGVTFLITEIVGGTAFGIYSTENPEEIKALDELVKVHTSAVTEISEDAYEADLKKKPVIPAYSSSTSSNFPQPNRNASVKGKGPVVVVEGRPDANIESVTPITGPVESIEEALATTQVETAPPIESEPPKQTQRGEKSRRKS